MAIELIGYITKTADGTSTFDISGSWTGGIGGPLQQNDIVFYAGCADAQALANPTGFTSIYNEADPTDIQLSWKRMGATPDTSISPIEESDGVRHVAVAFRGVDVTTAFDATTVGPTQGASGMPNSASITTATDNAWVLSVGFIDDDDASEATAPTGYTKIFVGAQSGSLSTQMWAYKVKSPAGAEDPAAWSSTDTDEWTAFTIALRPAAASHDRNATASITEGADTASAAATLALKATASIAEGADTSSAAGTVALKASSAITEAGDTLTATGGAAAIAGSLAVTEGGDTATAAGALRIAGSAAVTEGDDASSAAGALHLKAAAAPAEGDDTASAAGQVTIRALLALTEADDAIIAAGIVTQGPLAASLAAEEGDDTLAATGEDGDPWNPVARTSETWSGVALTSETWSAVPSTSESWSAQSATAETWTAVPPTSETWT